MKHQWTTIDGNMANPASWADGVPPAIAAVSSLTLTGNAVNAETVTLDTKIYTFQTVLTDVDGNVLIGASASDSIDNLIAAIMLGVGAGTVYAASMTLHPTVTAIVAVGDVMDCIAKFKGTDANTLATTETMTNGSFTGATLSGGTIWGATDEIIVTGKANVAFTTNLDWDTFVSPSLRVLRMNVSEEFTKPMGDPGNQLIFQLDKLNYNGSGDLHMKNTLPAVSSSDTPMYVIGSKTLITVWLDGVIGALWNIGSAVVEILSGATLSNKSSAAGVCINLGLISVINIRGQDEVGPEIIIPGRGIINNERKQAATTTFIVIAKLGILNQTGKLNVPGIFLVNLGGQMNYSPVNDPGAFGPFIEMLDGINVFSDTLFDISTIAPVIGPGAEFIEGSIDPLGTGLIDLRKDFPL